MNVCSDSQSLRQILLVSRASTLRFQLESVLQRAGWLVHRAADRVEALAQGIVHWPPPPQALQVGGKAPKPVLSEASEAGITVRIARAEGEKCERCWHYETDIGEHTAHPTLCGRCVAVLG